MKLHPAALGFLRSRYGLVCLVLLLAGRVAAQEFAIGLTQQALGLARDTQVARLHVRAVLLTHRDLAGHAPPEPVTYTEYDAQGWPVRQYTSVANRAGRQLLGDRFDLTYGPAGQLATAAYWTRRNPETDTSQLGRDWQAATYDDLPLPPAGTGTGKVWDTHGSLWVVQRQQRLTLRHDTTYLDILGPVGGAYRALERSYLAGPGLLHRTDRLEYDRTGRLLRATYNYELRDARDRPLEQGQLNCAADYQRAGLDTAGCTPAHDALARRSQGQRHPAYRWVYNAQGQLVGQGYAGEQPSQLVYNAAGQLLQIQEFYQHKPSVTTRYTYLPNGLRASYRCTRPDRRIQSEYTYHYLFR